MSLSLTFKLCKYVNFYAFNRSSNIESRIANSNEQLKREDWIRNSISDELKHLRIL